MAEESDREKHWEESLDFKARSVLDKDVLEGFYRMCKMMRQCFREANRERDFAKRGPLLTEAIGLIEHATIGHVDVSDNDKVMLRKYAQRALCYYHLCPSIPCMEGINAIVQFADISRILEVNAHRGLWGAFLRAVSVDITMIHDASKNYTKTYAVVQSVANVLEYVVDKQADYGCLMFCRPDHQENMGVAVACLKQYRGFKVIYIGPETNGLKDATPDNDMFQLLERDWTLVGHAEIPRWAGALDWVMMYTRRKPI